MNYDQYFKTLVVLLLVSVVQCGPQKQRPRQDFIEIKVTEKDLLAGPLALGHNQIEGNLRIELQQDTQTGERHLYIKAAFHQPIERNVFFPGVGPLDIEKGLYGGGVVGEKIDNPDNSGKGSIFKCGSKEPGCDIKSDGTNDKGSEFGTCDAGEPGC